MSYINVIYHIILVRQISIVPSIIYQWFTSVLRPGLVYLTHISP